MRQYCPVCFNHSLSLNSRGVVNVIINGMQMDAGRFLYCIERGQKLSNESERDFEKKLEEFFKWYSNFHNKKPISAIELLSSDYSCDNKCKLPVGHKCSVIDQLIDGGVLEEKLDKLCRKYNIPLNIEHFE